jgi:hypothetical protein
VIGDRRIDPEKIDVLMDEIRKFLTGEWTEQHAGHLVRPCSVCTHDFAVHQHARPGLDCAFAGCECDYFVKRSRFPRFRAWWDRHICGLVDEREMPIGGIR